MALLKEVEDLLAGLKLNADERKAVETILADDTRQAEIKRGYHGAAEADRLMTAARTAQQAADAKVAEADEKIRGWLAWYEEEQPKVEQYLTAVQAAERKENQLRGYLVSQGIDPDTALGTAPTTITTVNQPPAASPFDWGKVMDDPKFKQTFIPRDEATQSLNAVLQLGDIQHKLNLENRRLNGSDIEDFATLRNEAIAAKKPLDVYVAEKLGFETKKQELATAALEARAQKMADEKYAALVSRTGLPQPTTDIGSAPIFSDDFAGKGRMTEGEADRAAIERALAFTAANPSHASDMADPTF